MICRVPDKPFYIPDKESLKKNNCGKGRKTEIISWPAFSPFPIMFSKVSFARIVEAHDFVVNGKPS